MLKVGRGPRAQRSPRHRPTRARCRIASGRGSSLCRCWSSVEARIVGSTARVQPRRHDPQQAALRALVHKWPSGAESPLFARKRPVRSPGQSRPMTGADRLPAQAAAARPTVQAGFQAAPVPGAAVAQGRLPPRSAANCGRLRIELSSAAQPGCA